MSEQVSTSELLNQIITDRRYISAIDNNGNAVDLMVRSLTPSERLYAEYIYKKALSKGKKQGLLSQKQSMSDAISKGLWTKEKERLISIYEAEIKQLEKQRSFYSSSANKGKSLKFRNDIFKSRKKLSDIEEERNSYSVNSLEGYATQIRSNYLVSRMIQNYLGAQIWPTYDDFLDESDMTFIRNILLSMGAQQETTESDLRRIARAPQWTIMWGASKKTGDSLFGKSSTEYTTEQSLLCYWAMMYDSVYESMEKPADKIIEDDEALDKWFQDQKDEKKKTQKQKAAGRSATDRHAEQFIMVKNDEEADEIWELNSEWTLARLQKEAKIIEEKGSISEYKLRRGYIRRQLQLENSGKFAEARRTQASPRSFVG